MRKANLYLVTLFLTIGLCIPYVSFAKEQLAVMDLKAGHRIEKSMAEAFSAKIRDEIRRFGDYEVLSKKELDKIVKKTDLKKSLGCDDTPCLIDFGRAIGVKFMVAGSISKLGSTYTVDLRLINTEGDYAGVMRKVEKKCRCIEDDFFNSDKAVAALIMGKKEPEVIASAQKKTILKHEIKPEKITNSLGMKLVSIPAGTFMMGSPSDEPGRADDEKQHRVTISRPFYMQATEVTQGQWKKVMGNNPSRFKNYGDDFPVETVSWNDAQEFIKRLNQMEGTDKYRLPTEAEWEYASRAGTTTPFYTGNCISTDQANYDGSIPFSGCPTGKNRSRTVRIGSFSPNPKGLYDMYGNVWEWCADWKGAYPDGDVTDPKGPTYGNGRVLRGGSHLDDARNLRSARRFSYAPDYRDLDTGFRLVRDF